MITVSYSYQHKQRKLQHEAIASRIVHAVSSVLSLPPIIEVYFYDLPANIHGGVDIRPNRVVLSNSLGLREMPAILIHELIHVEQKVMGRLRVNPDGAYLWDGQLYSMSAPENLSNQQYLALPWEADVIQRLPQIVKIALS